MTLRAAYSGIINNLLQTNQALREWQKWVVRATEMGREKTPGAEKDTQAEKTKQDQQNMPLRMPKKNLPGGDSCAASTRRFRERLRLFVGTVEFKLMKGKHRKCRQKNRSFKLSVMRRDVSEKERQQWKRS